MDARVRHRDMKVNTALVLTTAFLASSISSVLLSQGFQTHLGKTPLSRVSRTRITGTSSRWTPSPCLHGQHPSMAVQAVSPCRIQLSPGRHARPRQPRGWGQSPATDSLGSQSRSGEEGSMGGRGLPPAPAPLGPWGATLLSPPQIPLQALLPLSCTVGLELHLHRL